MIIQDIEKSMQTSLQEEQKILSEKRIEELIKKYQEEKQKLADQITLAIEYNRQLDRQKINMVELNDKMYKLNKKIEQMNEIIKREKDKETETQKSVKKLEKNWNKLQDILKGNI